MPQLEIGLPLKDIEKPEPTTGWRAGWESTGLSYGDGIMEESVDRITKTYTDYSDHEEAYKAYASMTEFNTAGSLASEDKRRSYYNDAIKNGVFALDDDFNVVPGASHFNNAEMLYDTNIIKGALLAQRQGLNEDVLNVTYSQVVEEKAKALDEERKQSSQWRFHTAAFAGHVFRKETIVDFASPAKIMAGTLWKGAAKAFAVEASLATVGEIAREEQRHRHMEKANLDYTLWDSVENILIGAGLAGSIRGAGSAVQDWATFKKISSKVRTVEDKALFERYARRENFKLTQDTRKHIALEEKAVRDIDEGRVADVADHTEIDINTKVDDTIEEVNINDEVAKANPVNQDDIKVFERELDEVAEVKDPTEADPYEGMVEPKVADETINEVIDDPEIKALYDEIEAEKKALSPQAQKVKEAGEIPVGGSEDQTKQTVKDMFKRAETEDDIYKGMSQEELDEIERIKMGDPELQAKQKEIEDELNAFAAETAGVGGTPVFAQFGAELFGGTWNGLDYDEETGTFTFDPVRFMVGFLAGHVGKKIATNPKLQAKAKKEALAYAQRMHDKLEDTPFYQYITGIHKAVDDRGGKGLLARQAEEKAKSVKPKGKEVYHPEVDKTYIVGEDGNVYWESRRGWRESKQFGLKKTLEEIDEIGIDKYKAKLEKEKVEYEAELKRQREAEESPEFYKDQHTAPTRDKDGTTSIDNLTEIYPKDIYSKDAARLYGHGEKAKDDIAMYLLRKIKGNPDAKVTIYRSIPEDIDADINPGDWVTITKAYAKEHGDARFDGKYKLLEKEVKASDIITDGNSIHEQGYDPKDIGAKAIQPREYFKQVGKDLGLETFDVFEVGDELRLNLLIAPKGELKQGKGTQAMEKLIQYADEHNKRITLSPALPDDRKGTTSRARLVKFYKRFGFVENKGRYKDFSISDGMYREAKK